jgi:hypothetical protein
MHLQVLDLKKKYYINDPDHKDIFKSISTIANIYT